MAWSVFTLPFSSKSLHISLVWSTESFHETHSKKGAPALTHTFGWNYWERDPSLRWLNWSNICQASLVVLLSSWCWDCLKWPQTQRWESSEFWWHCLKTCIQKCMNFPSSQTNQFHFVIKPMWVIFLSSTVETVCSPIPTSYIFVELEAQRGRMIFSNVSTPW